MLFDSLQLREIFHLEFLRHLGRKLKPGCYALKGGANMRFFFGSFRYSEDMDLDASGLEVSALADTVMKILRSSSLLDTLKPFGISDVSAPNIKKAKQTQTTQRFKIHILASSGEDLLTKVEFSRRGFKGKIVVRPVSGSVLRAYKMPPLLVPHYDAQSAAMQKVEALALRKTVQARDIFDLYLLISRIGPGQPADIRLSKKILTSAYENIFQVSFEEFRDTVTAYLAEDDRKLYESLAIYDEIKLRAADFIGELREKK